MRLSIVILNYNVRYFLELCLKSVQAATADLEAEIIVVDNHSSDESCQMVAQLFPEVVLIENNENYGFSKGNNIGVAKAKGEYLCILNPDTVVAEDTFRKLLTYADELPNMGLLGCQLIDGTGNFLPESKRNIPTPMVAVKKLLGFSNGYYANHISPSDTGNVDILVGAFMLLKKSVYNEVGGFDEDYFMYGEDIDLSYKVLKAGYQNVYYGGTTILHYKGESTLKDQVYAKRFYGAMHVFYKKHFKANPILDVMVSVAIMLSRFFSKTPTPTPKNVSSHVVVTEAANFSAKLPFRVKTVRSLGEVSEGVQVVFDGNTIDFKSVINFMASSKKDKQLTFRVLSKNADFIIGSDSPRERGEVILL